MPNIQTQCPNCRQSVVANINQVYDTTQDPNAKMNLLSGAENMIHCQNCGYQGAVPVPTVYHDKEKELLLTFFPPELGLTLDEQQKRIGPFIQQIVERLPQKERKGYLFNPQSMMTHRGMIERILEADGITKEMLDQQENRMRLMQQMISTPDEKIEQAIKDHDEEIDNELFQSLSTLFETSMAQGDQESAMAIDRLRKNILEYSTLGKRLQAEIKEYEQAAKTLQEKGNELTREDLLELVVNASSESLVAAYVQMARPGFDYEFFQVMSDRIEEAEGDTRERMVELREFILEMTKKIDEEIQARREIAKRNLDAVIGSPNMRQVLEQNIRAIDDLFLQVAESELGISRQSGDIQRAAKIQEVVTILSEISQPSGEIQLLNELMMFDGTDDEFRALLEDRSEDFSDEFMQTISGLVSQISANENGTPDEDDGSYQRIQEIYQFALKKSMDEKFNQ